MKWRIHLAIILVMLMLGEMVMAYVTLGNSMVAVRQTVPCKMMTLMLMIFKALGI